MENDGIAVRAAERIEDLIISEIRRLQAKSKRADFTSVAHAAESRHGLTKSVSNLHIKRMATNGKIKIVIRGGAESFRIVEKEQNIENNNDEKLKRKVSNDEEKILECRDSLIQEAVTVEHSHSTQGQELGKPRQGSNDEEKFSECRESLMQEEEIVELSKITQGHKGSKREDYFLSSSDISCDDVLDFADRQDSLWGRETQNDTTIRRLDELERKVNEIVTRMNYEEHDRKKDRDGNRVVEEMFVRLGKVERENKILKDENMALKLENFDLKSEMLNKSPRKEPKLDEVPEKGGQWRFPTTIARTRDQISASFVSRNRFSLLDCDSRKEMNSNIQSKGFQNREKTQQKSQLTTTNLGNHGGARSRSENDTQNHGNTQQNTQPKISSSGSHEEKEILPTVNSTAIAKENANIHGNINPGDVSYSTAVLQGQRRSQWGQRTETNNQASTNRNFQHSQRDVVAGSLQQRPNRKRPVVSLVGDSIIKGIRKNEINHHVKHMSTYVKTFPGATTDDMESYIVPTLKKAPDVSIIHCGTNDLRKEDPETIARKITEIALKSKRTVKHVAVSSILARGDSDFLEGKRLQVNSLLVKSLADNEIQFIPHQNIDQEWCYLLFEDGIHLNNEGTKVLGQNFVTYINTI